MKQVRQSPVGASGRGRLGWSPPCLHSEPQFTRHRSQGQRDQEAEAGGQASAPPGLRPSEGPAGHLGGLASEETFCPRNSQDSTWKVEAPRELHRPTWRGSARTTHFAAITEHLLQVRAGCRGHSVPSRAPGQRGHSRNPRRALASAYSRGLSDVCATSRPSHELPSWRT